MEPSLGTRRFTVTGVGGNAVDYTIRSAMILSKGKAKGRSQVSYSKS